MSITSSAWSAGDPGGKSGTGINPGKCFVSPRAQLEQIILEFERASVKITKINSKFSDLWFFGGG